MPPPWRPASCTKRAAQSGGRRLDKPRTTPRTRKGKTPGEKSAGRSRIAWQGSPEVTHSSTAASSLSVTGASADRTTTRSKPLPSKPFPSRSSRSFRAPRTATPASSKAPFKASSSLKSPAAASGQSTATRHPQNGPAPSAGRLASPLTTAAFFFSRRRARASPPLAPAAAPAAVWSLIVRTSHPLEISGVLGQEGGWGLPL
mmetsp:Transcript_12878/g.30335  ORF Transcript_12878/g.30335 Transcript_12878/m.30335 type:complete len:202 (+) Transcript_12878:1015-1620(+)